MPIVGTGTSAVTRRASSDGIFSSTIENAPAPASAVIARAVPMLLVATRAPQADANGLPVAGSPYYRAAYAAFHLPDASG